jgi:hypothetical protein
MGFLLLSDEERERAAINVETPHPVETSHVWRVFYFHRTTSFHDPGVLADASCCYQSGVAPHSVACCRGRQHAGSLYTP